MYLKLINGVLIFAYLLLFLFKYAKYKYNFFQSIVCWFMMYYFFYGLVPCYFLDTIVKDQRLFLTETDITVTRTIIIFVSLFLLMAFAAAKQKISNGELNDGKGFEILYIMSSAVMPFALILSGYGVFRLVILIKNSGYIGSYFTLRETGNELMKTLKLKQLTYVLLPLTFYSYMKTKRKIWFLWIVMFLVFETLKGTRTNAFIYILFLYLLISRIRRKTYILYFGIIFFILLVGVLFTRVNAITSGKETNLSFMLIGAEFGNTFSTLPFIIHHNLCGSGFSLDTQLKEIVFGFMPGFIKESWNFSIGGDLATMMGGGYGRACFFITELVYLYGIAGVFLVPVFFLLFYFIDRHLSADNMFIFRLIAIFEMRLFVREGMVNISSAMYIMLLYILVPYLLSIKSRAVKNILTIPNTSIYENRILSV